jgi:hypothetical protein
MRLRRTLTPLLFALPLAIAGAAAPRPADAQVAASLSITVAPPALPVYVQPPIPAPGYMWTPGYWAWGPAGYYWVPGTWVLPPAVGLLWTPGYWGWAGGVFAWHAGYWGPHIGFYGGVNYGFGYGGVGFEGGYWAHGAFFYNTAVNNVHGAAFHNVYNKTVVNNVNVTRVSFNGGTGGLTARPNAQEEAAMHEAHRGPTALQAQHERVASTNPQLRASVNHGTPAAAFAATRRPEQAPQAHNAPAHPAGQAGAQHPPGAPGNNVHPAATAKQPTKAPNRTAEEHPNGGGDNDEHHHD